MAVNTFKLAVAGLTEEEEDEDGKTFSGTTGLAPNAMAEQSEGGTSFLNVKSSRALGSLPISSSVLEEVNSGALIAFVTAEEDALG